MAEDLSHRLADFAASFSLEHAPVRVLENAKIAILDCLGVAVLAASEEIGKILLSFARLNGSPGPCTVWGSEITSNSRDAALINGTLAHGLDYDDRNHASTYTLASTLAAAETCNASGASTLAAFIVGREIRTCLDGLFSKRSSGIGPGARGWHSNGILGPIASACAAGKIFNFRRDQTLCAIGLAAGSCGALTRDGGTMAKPFRVGHAAATGIICALLAREGFSADETPLEGRYGLLEALGPLPPDVLDSLGGSLGIEYDLERVGIRVKPFASCTATHAALDAMLRLVQKRTISALEVETIECDLRPYPLVRMSPKRGFEGRFSMPFCLAMALIYGRLNPEDFTDERVEEPLTQEVMRRTRHVPGSKSLIVILKDGIKISEPIQPARDLTGWDEVAHKFNQCVSKTTPDRQRLALLNLVARLEEIPSVRSLTELLHAQTH